MHGLLLERAWAVRSPQIQLVAIARCYLGACGKDRLCKSDREVVRLHRRAPRDEASSESRASIRRSPSRRVGVPSSELD